MEKVLMGKRQVVFITGEAGIGKSTLIEMLLERLTHFDADVLRASCIELFGTDEAFMPLIEALQDYCGGQTHLLESLKVHAPTWLAQMPGLLEDKDKALFQGEVFGATRERMLREFCEFIEVTSIDKPWVVILEDLHWSDFATLDAISRLARRDRKAAILVLATYRPVDVAIGQHPVRSVHQDLQIHKYCLEMPLGQLSIEELENYLLLRFGNPKIVRTLAGRIFERTRGQPLFFVSLVEDLVAQNVLAKTEGEWRLMKEDAISQYGMPRDVQEMIARQIERVDSEAQQLLEVASAAGGECPAALAAHVLDRDPVRTEVIFETLARRRQILESGAETVWPDGTVSGNYLLQHALYQEALYDRLAPGRRVQIHRRIGERLEKAYGAQTTEIAAVLARHFEQGRDFAKAVSYLTQAAENAAKRFSNEEASTYLTRALGLVQNLPESDTVMLQLKILQYRGWVRRAAGDMLGSIEDLHRMINFARESRQLEIEVIGLTDLSRFYLYAARQECLTTAELAVTKSTALNNPVTRALVEGSCANLRLMLSGWREEDMESCRNSADIMSTVEDPLVGLRRHTIESVLSFIKSDYLECCNEARRAKKIAQAIGDVYIFALMNSLEGFALLPLGRWRELIKIIDAALAMFEKNANPRAKASSLLTLAWLHAEALDFEGAKSQCERALELISPANPNLFFIAKYLLAKASIGLREFAAAQAFLAEITVKIEDDGIAMESYIYPHLHHSWCEYWLAKGDLLKAKQEASRLYEAAVRPPERTYLALAYRLFAKIALALGDFDEARLNLRDAFAILKEHELPIAAWRIYASAAHFHDHMGEEKEAAKFRLLAEKTVKNLVAGFDQGDPRRATFLSGFLNEDCLCLNPMRG